MIKIVSQKYGEVAAPFLSSCWCSLQAIQTHGMLEPGVAKRTSEVVVREGFPPSRGRTVIGRGAMMQNNQIL